MASLDFRELSSVFTVALEVEAGEDCKAMINIQELNGKKLA